MNIRTMTTAATWLAAAAVAFAGCAAEETTDTPTSNAANNNNNNTVTSNTAAGMGPTTTTTINTVGSGTTATVTAVTSTGTTGAGPTTTTATVTGATTASVTITNTATVNNTTGAGNTTGGGATCDAPPAAGTAPVIDDFEDNDHTISPNEGRLGYWYEYGDPAGTQMTAPLDGVDGMGGVLTATGSGFTEYVGFGVDLNNDNANSEPCPYDASFHTGISFDITNDVAVTFQIALPGTAADSDHWSIAVPAATNGTFMADFAMLAQGGWGDAVAWDAAEITQLQWQITDPTETFSITLDNVSFY